MNSILIPKQQESQSCKHQVLLKENFLSEFLTKSEKQKVIQNLGLSTTIELGKIKGYIEQQKDLIEVLSKFISKETEQAAQQILYSNDEYPNIKTLKDALDVLLYKDLAISVNITPNIAELGDTVENALLTWTYNKANIKQQTVDNMNIDKDIRQLSLDRPITSTITKKKNKWKRWNKDYFYLLEHVILLLVLKKMNVFGYYFQLIMVYQHL